ncbi:MAG: aminopeptidase P family protein [Acidobacteriota bacterium]|nr:aminopeptidase P family protein [Acidobacteriota bacterium]
MERLRNCFGRLSADAVLVTHLPNVRYLCGFSGSAGLLVVEPESATFFTDSRYTFQSKYEVTGARVQISKKGLLRAAGELLRARKSLRRVAYSPAQITVAQKQALDAAVSRKVRWIDDGSAVDKLRMIKDSSEIAAIREAAAIVSKTFERTAKRLRPGDSELDVAAEIERDFKRKGAEGPSFETIVASGERTAWPHARPTRKPIAKNELVLLDHGAILRGYCSDMTRTVFVGKAPRKIRSLYRAVLEALEAGKAAARPGVKAQDVDAAARGVLRRARLDRYFTHSTGHGVGLEIHESPRLGKGDETVLAEGMVITVEPGVYIEGLGGIRIEDDIAVNSRGAEQLTTAPRHLIEL